MLVRSHVGSAPPAEPCHLHEEMSPEGSDPVPCSPEHPPGSQLLRGTAAAAATATTRHPGFLCLGCSRPTQPSWLPSAAA